jgi:dTDP-L-rhamnose 4-epimerase
MACPVGAAFPQRLSPDVAGGFRLGDVRHAFGSTSLAREKLGFVAQEQFDDGIVELAAAPLRV